MAATVNACIHIKEDKSFCVEAERFVVGEGENERLAHILRLGFEVSIFASPAHLAAIAKVIEDFLQEMKEMEPQKEVRLGATFPGEQQG